MKADIERREKAQATVIENQAKRLEELETLYKVGTFAIDFFPHNHRAYFLSAGKRRCATKRHEHMFHPSRFPLFSLLSLAVSLLLLLLAKPSRRMMRSQYDAILGKRNASLSLLTHLYLCLSRLPFSAGQKLQIVLQNHIVFLPVAHPHSFANSPHLLPLQDENIMRKKYHNQMEDMKGKIRVFARVRPVLPFETQRGATNALVIPDVLSLHHMWKDKKREYAFDSVFEPGTPQETVRTCCCL